MSDEETKESPKLIKDVRVWAAGVTTIIGTLIALSGQIQDAWESWQMGRLEKVNQLCAVRIAEDLSIVEQYQFQGGDAVAQLFDDGTLYVKFRGNNGRQVQCFPAEGMDAILATASVNFLATAYAQPLLPKPAVRCFPEIFVEWVEKGKIGKYLRQCPGCTERYTVRESDGKILSYEEGPCINREE